MAKYYQDFVGLNTFMYEPVQYAASPTTEMITIAGGGTNTLAGQNHIGINLGMSSFIPKSVLQVYPLQPLLRLELIHLQRGIRI